MITKDHKTNAVIPRKQDNMHGSTEKGLQIMCIGTGHMFLFHPAMVGTNKFTTISLS